MAAFLLFCGALSGLLPGCAAPRTPRRGEVPSALPPKAIPPPVSIPGAPPPRAAVPPRPEQAGVRPVRVRMEGTPSSLVLGGDAIQAWNPGGSLVATESGSVRLLAMGTRIAWAGGKMLESPIDVSARGGLWMEGKRFPGRIRLFARSGGIQVVAVVPLEEYVAAVVSREAAPSFFPGALSALAVAVRTYTLLGMASPRDPEYDLVAGVEDQVFEGVEKVGEDFRAAVEATRGEVLYYGNHLARTVYHSTCGGMTESAGGAWGKDIPYLRSVRCEDCRESPMWRWTYRMDRAEGRRIALALGVHAGSDLRIGITVRTPSGRAGRVRLASGGIVRESKASRFRQAAGYTRVRSLWMEIDPVGAGWRFAGKGYGHGVGMCQWGANGMAKRGAGYREILSRYYPRTRLASFSVGGGPYAGGAGGRP